MPSSNLRFNVLVFGFRPSQYLVNAVVRKHAERYLKTDTAFAAKIQNSFYVDDLNTGVSRGGGRY